MKQAIIHISYINYAIVAYAKTSLHIEHLHKCFLDEVTIYPDGSLQIAENAMRYFLHNVVVPLQERKMHELAIKYDFSGKQLAKSNFAKIYKLNEIPARRKEYKGIYVLSADEFHLYYYAGWEKAHILSFPINDIAFNGELPFGTVSTTLLFDSIVTQETKDAFENMLSDWIENSHDKQTVYEGPVDLGYDTVEVNPFMANLIKNRSVEFCLDVSKSGQKTINWLIINLIHFCNTAVINSIEFQGITHSNRINHDKAAIWWH